MFNRYDRNLLDRLLLGRSELIDSALITENSFVLMYGRYWSDRSVQGA
jgi:hypothetical protein